MASRFDNHRKDRVYTGEIGMRFRVQTGAVSHEIVASAAMHDFEEKNAFTFFGPVIGNIYDPFAAPLPTTVTFPGGDLSDPKRTEQVSTQSLAIADTLGFSMIACGSRWAPAGKASKPGATRLLQAIASIVTTPMKPLRLPASFTN